MKKAELAILTGIILAIFLTQFTAFAQNCDEIRAQTLRLHVLANSDSDEDQALKLAVRDEILNEYGSIFSDVNSLDQALDAASGLKYAMEYTATNVVKEHGYNYAVNVELGKMHFDSKIYDGFTLPAGEYNALRIEIGNATGQNWFCVLYPALCLPAASSSEGMEVFSIEQKQVLKTDFEVKFALIEVLDGFTRQKN